jgi:anti-sigma B factor antagonist
MDIQDKQVNDVTILTIQGSIDALTAPKITEYINGLVSNDNIKLVADFGGVDYTSSAGLRMLLGGMQETRSKGGDLFLVDIQPDVEKVFKLSGFTSILKIFPDVDSAVESFS